MKALFESLVRTYVPWIVGGIVGWLVNIGVPLDAEVETQLTVVIVMAASGLYYLAVRMFERYISPKFGWLLGLAKQPIYEAGVTMDVNPLYPYKLPHGYVISGIGTGRCAVCDRPESEHELPEVGNASV